MLSVSKDFVLKIVKTSTFVFCTIVLSLITSSFNFHISNIGAVSETRYFRGDTQTVNSLSAYRLSTTQRVLQHKILLTQVRRAQETMV